jgi:hypothetical protein
MPIYKFQAHDQEGETRRGSFLAPSREEAEARLISRGFRVLELTSTEASAEASHENTKPSAPAASAPSETVEKLSLGVIATTIQVLPQLPKKPAKLSWRQRLFFSKTPPTSGLSDPLEPSESTNFETGDAEKAAAEPTTQPSPSGPAPVQVDVTSSARVSLGSVVTTIQALPQLPKKGSKLSWRKRLSFFKAPEKTVELSPAEPLEPEKLDTVEQSSRKMPDLGGIDFESVLSIPRSPAGPAWAPVQETMVPRPQAQVAMEPAPAASRFVRSLRPAGSLFIMLGVGVSLASAYLTPGHKPGRDPHPHAGRLGLSSQVKRIKIKGHLSSSGAPVDPASVEVTVHFPKIHLDLLKRGKDVGLRGDGQFDFDLALDMPNAPTEAWLSARSGEYESKVVPPVALIGEPPICEQTLLLTRLLK